jgi:flavin-dependent dehydrogenase
MPNVRRDVVVVGAGPAGAATAISLRRQGLSVTVLERSRQRRFRIGETVPTDVRPPLERLGAWAGFCEQDHLASTGTASAWGAAELVSSDALTQALGGGWHLDRARFDALLAQEAWRQGADVRIGVRLLGIGAEDDGEWSVHAVGAGGERATIGARFLVDATGRAATVARWLGASRLCHDRLVCAHAVLDPERPVIDGRSIVESTEDGWWYATPLPGQRALAGFFTDSETCRLNAYSSPQRWHDALRTTRHAFGHLGCPPRPLQIALAASTPHCLDRPAGVDWLAVGDAAASYDPLASSGLTLALRSGEQAASAIVLRQAGQRTAPARYGRAVQERFTDYLLQRREYYSLETRWPRSPFWERRRRGSPFPRDGLELPRPQGYAISRTACVVSTAS